MILLKKGENNMCNSQNKTGISFVIGVLVGAGASFFLSTKKGKKYVKEAWKKVEPYVDDVRDEIDGARVKGMDAIDDILTSAKDFAEDVEEKVPGNIKKPLKRTFFKGV